VFEFVPKGFGFLIMRSVKIRIADFVHLVHHNASKMRTWRSDF
jgi:hypothetical protein